MKSHLIQTESFFFFVQAAHEKMEEALHEREALKQRVHSYVDTVSRIENILKTKAREKCNSRG